MTRLTLLVAMCLACGAAESPESETSAGSEGSGEERELMVLEDDPHGEAVVGRLEAIRETALAAWEDQVRAILLETYDADGSGSIDTSVEVHRIVCEVWRTLDRELRRRSSETSLREAYGFAPGQVWQGTLGLDVATREHLRGDLLDCGVR